MKRTTNKTKHKLIYSIGKHPYLGFLIEPHVVQVSSNNTLSLAYNRVFSNTVNDFNLVLDETDYKIIKLLDEVEQTHVIKRYHKKAIRPADYFKTFFKENIYEYLRPKLEQKLLKALSLLENKPLYAMNGKDGYPADKKIHIAKEPTSILFHFRRNQEETRYFPTLKHNGQRLEFMFKNAQVIINTQAWLLLEDTLYHFDQELEGKKLAPFLNKRFISVPRKTEKKYFETFVKPLIEKHHVYAEGFEIKTTKENATALLTLFNIDNKDSQLKLSFKYGEHTYAAEGIKPVSVELSYKEEEDLYIFTRIKRSMQWEKGKQAFLEDLGLKKTEGFFPEYITKDPNSNVLEWLTANHDLLEDKNFVIEQAKSNNKRVFIGQTTLDFEVTETNDWFDIKAIVKFGNFEIPFILLREHILNEIPEYKLPNGEIAIIPKEWFTQYDHLFHFASKKEGLKLHFNHIGVLHDISEHTTLKLDRKLQNLANFEEIAQIQQPKGFYGELRPYQQAGYNWFHFLREYNLGGLLADDMGLGKTIQTLALLQHQKEELKDTNHTKTSLIILPTSLVYNWQKEADKFTPNLRILLHTGPNRAKVSDDFAKYDLIITTYGIVRVDEELIKEYFYNYIILDESQNIKNPTSKSFKAIKNLKSRHKLALSGTPIENSVTDIWSQMHFTNPGLLGNQTFFQNEFAQPIEKKNDENIAKKLQTIIKPFVLRRTKAQVATELPPKTEQIIYCDMSEEQSDLYESVKSVYRNALIDPQHAKTNWNLRFTILQGLTKLRQLANHPKMTIDDYTSGSGKFDAVIEMLNAVSSEGNKALVFSQFVKHLALFKAYFEQNKIPYAYLDGATKNREEAINYFKQNDEVKIFLISIKAGGTGLNLTEADYVFILDPWWNPAVEQQAIDRSHRIGQDRNVFIYKFITQNSIEEKIVALQNKKKSLATSLITTEESFVKSLSQEDLKELLK